MKIVIKLIVVRCLFFLLLIACTQPHRGATKHKEGDNKLSEVLRSDGLYNTHDTSLLRCGERISERYRTYCPLVIINNENAIHLRGASLDSSDLSIGFYSQLKKISELVGTISIENAKIKATLPIGLYVRGMRLKMFTAYFEGEIKDRDTIINWRMVPPYPKAPKKFNNDFKRLVEPKLLYFIESKELSGLDSLYQEKLRENEKRKN